MHTLLVNTIEIAAYPKTVVRNLAGLKRPQMAKILNIHRSACTPNLTAIWDFCFALLQVPSQALSKRNREECESFLPVACLLKSLLLLLHFNLQKQPLSVVRLWYHVKNRVVRGPTQATASNMRSTHKEKLTQEHIERWRPKTFSCWFILLPPHPLQCTQSIDKIQHKGKWPTRSNNA